MAQERYNVMWCAVMWCDTYNVTSHPARFLCAVLSCFHWHWFVFLNFLTYLYRTVGLDDAIKSIKNYELYSSDIVKKQLFGCLSDPRMRRRRMSNSGGGYTDPEYSILSIHAPFFYLTDASVGQSWADLFTFSFNAKLEQKRKFGFIDYTAVFQHCQDFYSLNTFSNSHWLCNYLFLIINIDIIIVINWFL